jgi:hypothetical protein
MLKSAASAVMLASVILLATSAGAIALRLYSLAYRALRHSEEDNADA